jgi:hypothetical protein
MLGVRADDPHDSLAADDLAILANPPNAAAHFHDANPLSGPIWAEKSTNQAL